MVATQYIGRLGGDEFTVIAESYNEQELEALAKTIVDEFKAAYCIDNNNVCFTVCIGIVQCNYNYISVIEVLRNADIVVYKAKEAGKGIYTLFELNLNVVINQDALKILKSDYLFR